MALDDEIQTAGTFFRFVEFDASQADRYPDTLERMRDGELHAAIVHGVFPAPLMEKLVERLERHDPPFLKTWFPEKFKAFFYGRNLNLTTTDPGTYFRDAAAFHAQLRLLFPDDLQLDARVGGILAQLDDGRPFVAAPGLHPGEHYMFTTLRAHLEGGFIPPHCDNEMAVRPTYGHLRTLVEPHILSFVLALSIAEGGGALEVYDLEFDPLATRLTNVDGAPQPSVEGVESVSFRLTPGSMIVVDSGCYLHRVSPVEGSRTRWTACSFMALSLKGDVNYCWG